MGFYDKYLLPRLLNLAMKAPEMTRLRRQLVPLASGRVWKSSGTSSQPQFVCRIFRCALLLAKN